MAIRDIHRRRHAAQNTPGEAHFLTFSCFKRRAFLSRDRTREYFIEALSRARIFHKFDLWAYVIMSNHVHLLIYPRRSIYDMGEIEAAIKLDVSRRALTYLRTHNPEGIKQLATGQKHTPYRFWTSGNGYDENITSYDDARDIADYIHNNPVRSGICAVPEEWEWSSAQEWTKEGSGKLRVDRHSLL